MNPPSHTPHPDPQLREQLLDFYLKTSTGEDLAGWLRDLGENPRGTVAEKQQRIRERTKYLSMPAEGVSAANRALSPALRLPVPGRAVRDPESAIGRIKGSALPAHSA